MPPKVADRTPGVRPHLALVAVQLFFGTWSIVGKIVLRYLPSTGLVAIRVAGGTFAFLVIQRTAKRFWLDRRSDYARLALYSLLGVAFNQLLFVKGLSLSTAVNANLLGTMIPVFTLLAGVVLGYERFSPRVALGVGVAACGAVYLVNPFRADFSGSTTLGNLLLLSNSFCYGLYLAISQEAIRRYGALTVITWVFLLGCVVTLPVGGYHLAHVPLAQLPLKVWLALLYTILVPTVGSYYLNAWALGRVAPSVVAVYIYLQPLIGFALAPLVLGEKLDAHVWVAAALIFAGVGVVITRRRSPVFDEVSERPDALSR
ncbi:MAG: DMT family transporter [Acidobacteria bacterium]|nr:DMT family transporter [Acidobacteriota bacterium]MCA1641510.1 DMT family transporter [Acidobacteriota bacterium]